MIVRMGLLQKPKQMSTDDFRRHWRDVHGPMAAKLPGLRRYHQNHVVDRTQRGISYPRSGYDIDGFSQLWFDDFPAMYRAFSSDLVPGLGADEKLFVGDLKLITTIPHVVIPKPKGVPLLKRMSTLKRRPDVTAETFMNEWFDTHSYLVKRMPGVVGYTQSLVVDRSLGRGKPATYDELPIDGIVELWFEDTDRLHAAFASDIGKTTTTHGAEFLSEVSTFLVETHEVI